MKVLLLVFPSFSPIPRESQCKACICLLVVLLSIWWEKMALYVVKLVKSVESLFIYDISIFFYLTSEKLQWLVKMWNHFSLWAWEGGFNGSNLVVTEIPGSKPKEGGRCSKFFQWRNNANEILHVDGIVQFGHDAVKSHIVNYYYVFLYIYVGVWASLCIPWLIPQDPEINS